MNLVFVVSFHTEELGKHLSIKGFHKENMLNPATTNWEFAKKNGARKMGDLSSGNQAQQLKTPILYRIQLLRLNIS